MSRKTRILGAMAGAILLLFLVLPPREATTSGEDTGYGAVAGGLYHTLVATPGGQLWAFGDNYHGGLGDGTNNDRYVPGLVSSLSDIKAVAASYGLSLALEEDADLWTFGNNNNGQLGDGSTTNRNTPYKVLTGVVSMAAGEVHAIAVKTDGSVLVWGANAQGQLGLGSTSSTDQKTPIQVPGLSGVAKVAAGQYFSMALKTDGTVLAWGYNGTGNLGQGDTTLRASPTAIAGLTGIVAIAAGQNHALALRSDGQAFAWGSGTYGQIGDGSQGQNRLTPVQLPECPPVVEIAAGQSHSLAYSETGVVYAWGRQLEGQVGDGTTVSYRTSPVALDAPDDIGALGAGYDHSVVISRDGSVWAFGHNFQGAVGDGTTTDRLAPVRIADAGFAWLVGSPLFSPTPAWSSTPVAVTMTSHTPGAEIRYTTDDSEPTGGSTVYTGAVTPDVSTTLKAKAFKSGQSSSSTTSWYYEYRAVAPTITPGTATYTTAQTVTMSTTTSGATIRYTTDATEPTETSTAYTGGFSVSTKTTVKAVTFKTGWTPSTTTSRTYSFNYGTATAPTVNPATGTYTDSVTVTMSGQAGATIRYTTNGTDPTTSSTIYSAPLETTALTTIKAKAFHLDYATSATTTRTYTIQLSAPVLTPGTGTYSVGQSVTLSAHAGTTIRYNLGGTTPTATDPGVAPGTILRIVATSTIKAAAFRTGATTSGTTTATYTISGSPPDVAVDGGNFSSMVRVPTGELWVFGQNSAGQLGDGTSTQSNSPKVLATPTGVSHAQMGGQHTLSVDANVARAWGSGGYGRLGNGGTTGSNTPVSVSLPATASRVAAGWTHSLVLKTDGTVWASGSNLSGELGNNTSGGGNNSTPVQVKDQAGTGYLTDVTAIAVGQKHSLALKSDGPCTPGGRTSTARSPRPAA